MARPSKYPPELRRRAIAEVIERDRKIPEVARELGIGSAETLRNWVKQARRDAGLEVGPTTEELAEIRKLRKRKAVRLVLWISAWLRPRRREFASFPAPGGASFGVSLGASPCRPGEGASLNRTLAGTES